MAGGPDLRRLAVVYDRWSVNPFSLAAAARDVCELVWVVDEGDEELVSLLPLLRRFGKVVEVGGMSDDEVALAVSRLAPHGVMTFSDQVARAAAVAEASGAWFHDRHVAELLSNKSAQRRALRAAGVEGPGFWPVPREATAGVRSALAAEMLYPVVLKPEDGLGSRDTYRVEDSPTLLRLLAAAHRRSQDMLVEELLPETHGRDTAGFGDLVMVDTLVRGGEVTHVVVAGHFVPAEPFRGTGSFISSHLGPAETAEVLSATEAALSALGVRDGFTNTDLILTPEGVRVVEVNGRIGGQIPELLTMAGGTALLPEAMKLSVGMGEVDIAPYRDGPVAFCAMYQPPLEARRLLDLDGMDEIGQLPGVVRVLRNKEIGEPLDWREGTMSRLFTVYGVVDDHGSLLRLYERIRQTARPRYETDPSPAPPDAPPTLAGLAG